MRELLNSPVLIITYARPDGLASILKTLEELGPRRVYIAIDGPKNLEIKELQIGYMEIMQTVTENKILRLEIWRRSENLGIGASIISALDWFFSKESSGIIIEDDLIISKDFLTFVETGLEYFAQDLKVLMISGSQFDFNGNYPTNLSWTNYPIIWGWGTWASKWTEIRKLIFRKKRIYPLIYSANSNFFRVGALRTLNGLIDTWDIPFAFEMMREKAHCVLPPVNLVSNIGTDKLAEHTKESIYPLHLPIQKLDEDLEWNYNNRALIEKSINKNLEKKVFKIKFRHIFLPVFAFLQDKFMLRKKVGLDSLSERLRNIKMPI